MGIRVMRTEVELLAKLAETKLRAIQLDIIKHRTLTDTIELCVVKMNISTLEWMINAPN